MTDAPAIANIGRISVEEAHRESCSAADMKLFLDAHYNNSAIEAELSEPGNIYHVLEHEDEIAGFSKVVMNCRHNNVPREDVMKLDRIYLLPSHYGLKLALGLFKFNLALARENAQSGVWLFTWKGNRRALDFYFRAGFTVIGSHLFKVTDDHYNEHHQMFLDLG